MELLELTTGIWTSTSTALTPTRVVKNVECPFPAALKIQRYVFSKNSTQLSLSDPRPIHSYLWLINIKPIGAIWSLWSWSWKDIVKDPLWHIAWLSMSSRRLTKKCQLSWLVSNRTSRPHRLCQHSKVWERLGGVILTKAFFWQKNVLTAALCARRWQSCFTVMKVAQEPFFYFLSSDPRTCCSTKVILFDSNTSVEMEII